MEKISGVYKIENMINKHIYIGSSINIKKRWDVHKYSLRKNKHDNNYLQNAWNKYGENNFKFEIIEIIEDINIILKREQYYINLFKSLNNKSIYNICLIAGNMIGFKHSEETKNNFTKKRIGNKYSYGYKHTDEARNNMSNGHYGLKHKHETIKKMIKNKKNQTNNKYKPIKGKIYDNNLKLEIIEKYKTGEFSTRMLSKIYNISKSTIWTIIR